MKNILKIVCSTDEGGVLTSELQYIRIFSELGYNVELLIIGNRTPQSEDYESLSSNFHYIDIKLEDFSGSWVTKFSNIRCLLNKCEILAKEFSTNSFFSAIIFRRANYLFLAGKIGKRINSKVFWHMPNSISSQSKRKLYSFFHDFYNIIPIANSKYTLSSYGSKCKHVIYPGFDLARVSGGSEKYRKQLGIPSDVIVYGCIARICFDKAQDILIEAFKLSKAYKEGSHLIIAGGYDNIDFKIKIEELIGDSRKIHLIGKVSDVNEFYSSIDVLVNSRRNVEAFGISIAEAMATGTPVLAFKLGGPSELIVHQKSGWLIEEPTVDSYIEGINLSFDERDQWTRIGEEALLNSPIFSAQYNVKKFINLIETVM